MPSTRLAESAKIHAGHVFTLGHGYKLLDESFYYHAAGSELVDADAHG